MLLVPVTIHSLRLGQSQQIPSGDEAPAFRVTRGRHFPTRATPTRVLPGVTAYVADKSTVSNSGWLM